MINCISVKETRSTEPKLQSYWRVVRSCRNQLETIIRERDKAANFKRDTTADFQNETKQPIFKTVQNRRLVKIKIADFVNA